MPYNLIRICMLLCFVMAVTSLAYAETNLASLPAAKREQIIRASLFAFDNEEHGDIEDLTGNQDVRNYSYGRSAQNQRQQQQSQSRQYSSRSSSQNMQQRASQQDLERIQRHQNERLQQNQNEARYQNRSQYQSNGNEFDPVGEVDQGVRGGLRNLEQGAENFIGSKLRNLSRTLRR